MTRRHTVTPATRRRECERRCRHEPDVDRTFTRARRTFIAFSFEALAILASICFHDDSNASSEEVHMDIQSTNHQKSTLCAAVAGIHALLG
jgi:hypothetical protein